ncbi:hypothetical protein KY285_000693 [Solanum tuberosum]|nr:hypothetical protein KY285_000693 [Solanum tuberosum]
MRSLTYHSHVATYQTTSSGASFQRVIKVAMEHELVCHKEFRDLTDKRSCTSSYFSGTSSGWR